MVLQVVQNSRRVRNKIARGSRGGGRLALDVAVKSPKDHKALPERGCILRTVKKRGNKT